MKRADQPGFAEALKVGLLELLIVLFGLIFVRKEVYLSAQYRSMILHWQEYALLLLMFVDGMFRASGELRAAAVYMSPFRRKYLRYLLPATLFLFVSCSSLCDKLNAACIHEEWWRDAGLLLLAGGVGLAIWSGKTKPAGLELSAATVNEAEQTAPADPQNMAATEPEKDSQSNETTEPENGLLSKETTGTEKDPPSGDKAEGAISFECPDELHTNGPWKMIRYPGRTAILLELVGVSMTLSAWMPLLSLPGLFVAFKWELGDVEAFRISQFGEKYLSYRKKSWLLIPYIY